MNNLTYGITPHRTLLSSSCYRAVFILLLCIGNIFTAFAQQVEAWETRGNQSVLLSKQADISFQSGTSSARKVIDLNDAVQYQSITGFGFTLTQGSAEALMTLSQQERSALLHELFDPSQNNLSAIRISIGASDLSNSSYSYQEANVSGSNFTPDPNKTYYIDVPDLGLRLGADGNNETPFAVPNTPEGTNYEWRFISSGDGHWYIERANGGSLPRLRSDDTASADMDPSSSNGTWEKWALSQGEYFGTYFLSLPLKGRGSNRRNSYDRLQIDNSGNVNLVDMGQNAGTWESFSFTEVNSIGSFSLAGPDQDYLIPVLQEILAINSNIKLLATPWSAPRWMKTNNSWIGGSLKSEYYAAYAQYFVTYLNQMTNLGLPIWAVTPQNEPENPYNEPSMSMTASEQLDFVDNHLGPAISASGHSVEIIGFDHNCDNTDYPITVANGSAYVNGSAFHLYGGDISAMTTVKEATGKDVYFTEQWTGIGGNFSNDLSWHIQNVVIGSLNNWSKTVFSWNLADFPGSFPRTPGGCDHCLGAITIDNGSFQRNVAYYIISQIARFVDPEAVRIDSQSDIAQVAFKNPDGSYALLVYNPQNKGETVGVNMSGQYFEYNVPAKTAVTFKWGGGSAARLSKNIVPATGGVLIGPNPIQQGGLLYLSFQNAEETSHIVRLYGADGKLLLEKIDNSNKMSFDTKSFSSGLYIIEIIEGGYHQTQRLIIK